MRNETKQHSAVEGLEYIAESPAPEYGGFHPRTVEIAKSALSEITKLHSDEDALLSEHRDMVRLLSRCVDVMRVTERLFQLKAGHMLMTTCADVEHWLEDHQ